jgi:uncharacterized repeat protein (TIGR03803 family)
MLHVFTGLADGSYPATPLVFDSAGNLYGTTEGGGANCNCGVAFELSPDSNGRWQETVLHSFGATGDKYGPISGLTFDQYGNAYGTALTTGEIGNSACGAVFELTPSGAGWSEALLYEFAGYPSDGCAPFGGVLVNSAGNLFGTTQGGGINGNAYEGGGTVFEITP